MLAKGVFGRSTSAPPVPKAVLPYLRPNYAGEVGPLQPTFMAWVTIGRHEPEGLA